MDFKPMIVVFLVLSVCQVNGWFGQEEDNVKSMATLMRKMDSIQLEIDSIKRSMEIQEKKKHHDNHGSTTIEPTPVRPGKTAKTKMITH